MCRCVQHSAFYIYIPKWNKKYWVSSLTLSCSGSGCLCVARAHMCEKAAMMTPCGGKERNSGAFSYTATLKARRDRSFITRRRAEAQLSTRALQRLALSSRKHKVKLIVKERGARSLFASPYKGFWFRSGAMNHNDSHIKFTCQSPAWKWNFKTQRHTVLVRLAPAVGRYSGIH